MRITIEMVGTTPLLTHNIRLADPDDEIVRQIAAITSKRKKTEDDRLAIAKLEWYGGLYRVNGGPPIMPTGNIRKCLIQAAKINRQGIQVSRALAFTELQVPIAYEGPDDVDELFTHAEFHHRSSVGIGTKRTQRTRPQFPRWALIANAELFEDAMDLDDLTAVASRAGRIEGLGDNRTNGYGRFTAKVVEA